MAVLNHVGHLLPNELLVLNGRFVRPPLEALLQFLLSPVLVVQYHRNPLVPELSEEGGRRVVKEVNVLRKVGSPSCSGGKSLPASGGGEFSRQGLD